MHLVENLRVLQVLCIGHYWFRKVGSWDCILWIFGYWNILRNCLEVNCVFQIHKLVSFWCGFTITPWYWQLRHLCDVLPVWQPHLCDNHVCVTTRLCDDPSMWWPVCVTTLSRGLGWGLWLWNGIRYFYGSQWIICCFIVTLVSLVLQYIYHSCHDVKEIYFVEFKWKFPNYSMFVKCSLS